MWNVKRILRSFADAFSQKNWSRVVEATQGEWQGETVDGVSVGKCGRLTMWCAFGNPGATLEIPPSPHDYCAVLVDGANKESASGSATGLPVKAGQKTVVVNSAKSFFIQGVFMNILDVKGGA